jgi:serine/threonine protein kinase
MGKVKVAVHQHTGRKVAAKIIPRAVQDEATGKPAVDTDNKEVRVVREAAILQLLRHPNVVRLHDMIVQPKHFYLFFEYVSGGQMLDYIISHGKLRERVARKFVRQMVSAVGTAIH